MNCTNKQDFINAQCLSESALGMIRSCALPSFEHTLGKLTWGLHYLWCRIYIRSQQKHAAENEEIDEICYISHGIGSVLNEQMQLICVILSLYKAPLRLIGRCFYCMDCSCLFTFWRWSVLIYYIHISVKFLNGVFSQQQQKKNYSPMFLYLIY